MFRLANRSHVFRVERGLNNKPGYIASTEPQLRPLSPIADFPLVKDHGTLYSLTVLET
jgi:hypothetical protein